MILYDYVQYPEISTVFCMFDTGGASLHSTFYKSFLLFLTYFYIKIMENSIMQIIEKHLFLSLSKISSAEKEKH